jgi:uncharacterized protein (TIGR03437 family)
MDSVSSPTGVAINNLGRAVVTNQFNNSVTVVDVAKRQVLAIVPVGSGPVGVAVNASTNVAVVANSLGNSISLVDMVGLKEIAVVDGIPTATGLQSVAVDSELNLAVVASSSQNSVFIVDLAAKSIRKVIPVEQLPSGVAIELKTHTAVVSNQNSNSLTLIDLKNLVVIDTVTNIPSPQAVAISPATRSALVTTGVNATLQVVNVPAAAVENILENLPSASGVAFNASTGRAVVTLTNNNSVAIIPSLGLVTVVNAASFVPGPIAPGSIVSGFGSGLAATTGGAVSVPLPTKVADVTVNVGGTLAPLFFVSPQQINFQIPRLASGTFPVQVFSAGKRVASGTVAVTVASPAIFTTNQQGTGQGAGINDDGHPNGDLPPPGSDDHSGSGPVKVGGVIQLFGTGGGRTNPDPPLGDAAPSSAPTIAGTPLAQVGGLAATVLYSGAAPGLVGVWQVNVRIPSTVRPGANVPVILTLTGKTAPTVTIAVQ